MLFTVVVAGICAGRTAGSDLYVETYVFAFSALNFASASALEENTVPFSFARVYAASCAGVRLIAAEVVIGGAVAFGCVTAVDDGLATCGATLTVLGFCVLGVIVAGFGVYGVKPGFAEELDLDGDEIEGFETEDELGLYELELELDGRDILEPDERELDEELRPDEELEEERPLEPEDLLPASAYGRNMLIASAKIINRLEIFLSIGIFLVRVLNEIMTY